MPISNYLAALRQNVGHDLILTPSVSVLCRDEQGRILTARHHDHDLWAIPGGAIDPDETPANAAVREMWEETGLLIEPLRVLGVYGGPEFAITYPNGDQVSYVDTIFECRIIGGQIKPEAAEIGEVAWLSQAELATRNLSLWMPPVLDDLFSLQPATHFQPVRWSPPPDGVRKGGIPEFVRNLRQKIGHDLLLLPAIGALVFDEQGRILLQQRADNRRWTPPGGAIEPNEAPVDAVVREVWEETGLLVDPVRVLGVYGGSRFRNIHANGDQTAATVMIFECKPRAGTLSPDGVESIDVGFFSVEQVFPSLSESWRKRIELTLTKRTDAYFDPPSW